MPRNSLGAQGWSRFPWYRVSLCLKGWGLGEKCPMESDTSKHLHSRFPLGHRLELPFGKRLICPAYFWLANTPQPLQLSPWESFSIWRDVCFSCSFPPRQVQGHPFLPMCIPGLLFCHQTLYIAVFGFLEQKMILQIFSELRWLWGPGDWVQAQFLKAIYFTGGAFGGAQVNCSVQLT